MATRSLMALDYSNYHSNNVLKKHAKNRPLGAIEEKHAYVPAQPVLSCRTVDIDLPGTRTYRPRSTVDILEEQQRLIRSLRSRAAASAPPRPATEPAPRTLSDAGHKRVNIEVKGRPLTSQSQGTTLTSDKTERSVRRPKTTGRLKNVQPATDSFMVIKVDKELLASSQSTRELTSKLHAYWRSDPQALATGRFVRGQKRPDDVPPSLDAWLTFGGAAGEGSQGVIDAFASFKSVDEYYNIEGSVGSRVAQQLRKGDKIRIGINGVVQSHDFRVKRWHKDSAGASNANTPPEQLWRKKGALVDFAENPEEEEEDEWPGGVEEARREIRGGVSADLEEDTDHRVQSTDIPDDPDGDFKELVIGGLDELLEDAENSDLLGGPPSRQGAMHQESQTSLMEESCSRPSSSPPVIVPLSWEDQCAKPDVKVLQPTVSPRDPVRPVMSETFPVTFEKLITGSPHPTLAQPNKDGYKIKNRPLSKMSNQSRSASKVKVVYIDPLTSEDEARISRMSVEEIVSAKVDARGGSSHQHTRRRHRSRSKGDGVNNRNGTQMMTNGAAPTNIIAINESTGPPMARKRSGSANSGGKAGGVPSGRRSAGGGLGSRASSRHSLLSDSARVASPKLKTLPVHPAAAMQQHQQGLHYPDVNGHQHQQQLNISAHQGSGLDPPPSPSAPAGRSARSTTPSGRVGPPKPAIQRLGSGHKAGSKVRGEAGHHQHHHQSQQPYGEPEYIQITTKLNTGVSHQNSPFPASNRQSQHRENGHSFAPGTNTPRDLDYQEAVPGDYITAGMELSPRVRPIENTAKPVAASNEEVGKPPEEDNVNTRASSSLSESPPPTTVAISIPTADELSDRDESPSNSPPRGLTGVSPDSAALTPLQRRARDLRNEQIDQITDLLGAAIVKEP